MKKYLMKTELFKNVDLSRFEKEIFSSFVLKSYKANEIVIGPKKENDMVGIVISGSIGIRNENEEFIDLITKDKLFGINDLFESTKIDYVYETLKISTICLFKKELLTNTLLNDKQIMFNFSQELSQKLRNQIYFQYLIKQKDTKSKLLGFKELLSINDLDFKHVCQKKKDLARLLNVSRTNLIRVLKKLEDKKEI